MKDKKKILLFDIETAPNLAYVWGTYEQNVIRFNREGYMISFACKWLGEDKVYGYTLKDFGRYKKDRHDDSELAAKLWEFLDKADIVIAHNGDRFDIKKSNAFFIANGLKPPSPYKTIDTKKVAKKHFMFNSNKLDDLGEHLGLGRKLDTGGFDLWLGCLDGDIKAWNKMLKYNKQDVVLLERVYLKLLPWIENHPRVKSEPRFDIDCNNCGSHNLHSRGYNVTTTSKKRRYQCQECGAWMLGNNERDEKTTHRPSNKER